MEYCCIIKGKKEKGVEDYEFWSDDDVWVISDFFEKVKTDNDLLSSKPWFIGSPAPSCVEICLYGEIMTITLHPTDYDDYLSLDRKFNDLVLFLYSICEGENYE